MVEGCDWLFRNNVEIMCEMHKHEWRREEWSGRVKTDMDGYRADARTRGKVHCRVVRERKRRVIKEGEREREREREGERERKRKRERE